ncbi:MAG: 3-isopropylmalate dehydrogenase [Bacteroidota bacterium]
MSNQQKFNVAVLPGDGIGPEVIEQGIKVLDAVADRFDFSLEYCVGDIGAIAIDRHGTPLPDETIDACMKADAVFLGAIGHPKYDHDPSAKVRPEQGLLKLRKSLGLYANIRPVTVYPELADLSPLKRHILDGTDFVIYRELTSGIYFGDRGRNPEENGAYDTCYYNEAEIRRITALAFDAARQRSGKVTLVDKANVLESSRLWREIVREMAADAEGIELEYLFVDNAAMQMIVAPSQFDVVLTSNMFGDILSDEGSVIAGSLGMLPSASIGEHSSLFEPVHGSYPQAAGKDIANPLATILSGAMMLESLGQFDAAKAIRDAVALICRFGIGTQDLKMNITCSCSQLGDLITSAIQEGETFGLRRGTIEESVSTII